MRVLAQLPSAIRRRCSRALTAAVTRLPLSTIGPLAKSWHALSSSCSASLRAEGRIRQEAGARLFGVDSRDSRHAEALERLVDMRVYTPKHQDAWPGQREAARALAQQVREAWASGRPAILAPFHYLSQYVNVGVCDAVRRELGMPSLSIVSGVPSDQLGSDASIIPNIRILHTSAEDFRQQMGLSVVKALKRERLLVVFADVPPFELGGEPRETTPVTICGRPARIYNGVFRLGAPFDAQLIPFYLRYTGREIVGHVLPSIDLAHEDARQQLADRIETALRHNYAQWLPAGHPSLYWYSPSR